MVPVVTHTTILHLYCWYGIIVNPYNEEAPVALSMAFPVMKPTIITYTDVKVCAELARYFVSVTYDICSVMYDVVTQLWLSR